MCGLFFGLLLLFFFFKMMRYGRHGWRGCGGGQGRRRGGGRGFGSWIFDDLDATPGQEREIRDAVDELKHSVKGFKDSLKDSLSNVADALSHEEFDHEAVGEAWIKQDQALETLRLSVVEALGSIHSTLDERQRERLAKVIKRRSL